MLAINQSESIVLERDTVNRLLMEGNGDASLLYLYLIRENGHLIPQKAAAALKKSSSWVHQTLKTLEKWGLVRREKSDISSSKTASQWEETAPSYTNEEITKEMESQSPFPSLVQETQRRLGRALTTADLKILFGLYDYLNLPVEVISLLITFCQEEIQRQAGEGTSRPLRMRQVEREAYRWKRQGVDTLDKAVEHLKYLSLRRASYGEIFQILQLGGRAPSPSERSYMDSFLDMGFSMEAIGLAYDKTVLQTGSLKWPYLNSILKRWHQKNLHTLEEIKAGDGLAKQEKTKVFPSSSQIKPEDQEAIEWMKELVRRQKQDG